MKHLKQQQGFTLVELAIVMTIIGLLIGGILKGQELMENARVTATIAQVKAYEAAVTTFRDTYSALPGDMKNADTRIPGCNMECDIGDAADAGNSIVGGAGDIELAQTDMTDDIDKETVLFWTQMGLADLISGVTSGILDAPTNALSLAWGESHPAAKIGGGFHVRHANGADGPIGGFPQILDVSVAPPAPGPAIPSGLHLVLSNGVNEDFDIPAAAAGRMPISPNRAATIDRKMDDGEAGRGFVRGMGASLANDGGMGTLQADGGAPGECFFDSNGDSETTNYNEKSTQKDCSLLFRIQG